MMEFNATFLIAMLSFVVFIMIMNAIFYNPILSIIRKREDYINSNYEDAKRFENSALEFNTTRAAKLEQVQEKCRHEFKTVVDAAQTDASDRIKAARENSKVDIQSKKDDLLKNEQVLKNQIKATVVKDLASSIATKLLGEDTKIDSVDFEPVNRVME